MRVCLPALARAGARDWPIHLLVTDMVMPAMNGREPAACIDRPVVIIMLLT